MFLHEFMAHHRPQILELCRLRLHQDLPAGANVDVHIETFFDEVYRALKRESGHPDSQSPLPGRSDAAERLGAEPQRAGIEPSKVPLIFGAISRSIGEVGARYDLVISADEYKVFNQCIDAGVATSIERYWQQEQHEQRQRVSASVGYLAHELRVALGNASLAFKLMRTGEVALNGKTASVLSNSLTRMEALINRTLGEAQLDAAERTGPREPAHDLQLARYVNRRRSAGFGSLAVRSL